ncbi:MAG: methionine synthase, partial [Tannerella sp.]|nr:methionine synthase [Tannerella sp.]
MDNCVAYSEIELSSDEVLSEIGYGESLPDCEVRETIHRLLAALKCKVQPRYVYLISDGWIEGTSAVHIRNCVLNTGPTISRLLEKSSAFAVFAATAGVEFEQIAREYKKTEDILTRYILDVMGTAIVEKLSDYMELKLEETVPDMRHTHRFSPGYCNWHLTEQRKIFSLLGNHPCGITLSDVCLMNPVKSVSGIIG